MLYRLLNPIRKDRKMPARKMLTTVAAIDKELEETKKKLAKLKEERKAAAAKEREQEKEWRADTLSVISELLLESLGCSWKEVDLNELSVSLNEWAQRESVYSSILVDDRTSTEAKQALDSFKKSRRKAKKSRLTSPVEPSDTNIEAEISSEVIPTNIPTQHDNKSTW